MCTPNLNEWAEDSKGKHYRKYVYWRLVKLMGERKIDTTHIPLSGWIAKEVRKRVEFARKRESNAKTLSQMQWWDGIAKYWETYA